MIALLNCSTSWCQTNVNDTIFSTGDVKEQDSIVAIPVSMLKQANAKMVELKYEKQINSELKQIIVNDSIIIKGLKENTEFYKALAESKNKEAKKYKRQRNFIGYITIIISAIAVVIAVK